MLITPISSAPTKVAPDAPPAAGETGSADHHGGDNVQFVTRAGDGFGGVQTGAEDEGTDPRGETGNTVDDRLEKGRVDAREPDCFFVAAYGVSIPAPAAFG